VCRFAIQSFGDKAQPMHFAAGLLKPGPLKIFSAIDANSHSMWLS
jgi:hypothetical protein